MKITSNIADVLTKVSGLSASEAAKEIAKGGYPVFPCKTDKRPYTQHGFKDATTELNQVAKWWAEWPEANIGLPTGRGCGLVVLDVDAEEAEAQAVDRFGSIPDTFTVQTPRGGKHYYFQYSGKCRIKNGTNILGIKKLDVRADEGYVIAPPSKGDKGSYKVINAHIPALLPDWLEESHSVSEYSENAEKSEAISEGSAISDISAISDTVSVDGVIQATLPMVQGERNRRILDLARGLKYDCGLANEKLINVRPYVQQWHKLAIPVIGTKPFEDTWEDFVIAWKSAKHSLLISPLLTAYQRAQGGSSPTEAKRYENAQTKLLVGICWNLSRDESRRFFLSSHTVGELLGIPPATVYKRLRMLIADEIIKLVSKGNEHKANRYKWIAE